MEGGWDGDGDLPNGIKDGKETALIGCLEHIFKLFINLSYKNLIYFYFWNQNATKPPKHSFYAIF